MEESTTTAPGFDAGAEQAQPVEQVTDQVAENQPVESTEPNDSQEQAAPSDDNLAWLQNKGIDPSDPEAVAKVAKMYRDAEKAMHSSAQEKAQLQQALSQPPAPENYTDPATGQVDPVAQLQQTVQAMQTKQTVDDFFSSNPDAKAYEESMIKIVTDSPAMSQLVQAGYLSVPQLYQMARGADPSIEAKARTEGGREALQKVADKQSSKAVQGNATSSAFSSGEAKDPFREALLGRL